MSIATFLARVTAQLEEAGVPDPRVDAELLLGHILGEGRGRVQSLAILGETLTPDQRELGEELALRRAARVPLQHITGIAPFRGLSLAVGPGVFVPRPETEFVVQFAIDALRESSLERPIAVDLGTGSGAIALAMATEVPHSDVYGIEKSSDAFSWAQKNFYSVDAKNAQLIRGDLAEAVPHLAGRVSVVISNPPYIPVAAVPRDPEVRIFDPEIALYGGEDGLDVVRTVSIVAQRLLVVGGTLVLEHAEQQGENIRDILRADGWQNPTTHKDFTDRDRATVARR
ncbi:peptide chain release factor N(5)-glutamine methyltransferase [Lysinibacter sp. HNR]|uniref:peptide chain release factor N(5)-glutamine methyltransferase n=1 Tax=Lysinibacter sp. HNR TaxID=3031408 RepID=UPI00243510C2|nr:peptide chain release factor N(5)-glutamine methyltransferase [Lysinibacter sp. HNR]WGD38652.1 peptide chain release factor N(5)-glutamine methyltransferase [Lysinibacter sp. HNR]